MEWKTPPPSIVNLLRGTTETQKMSVGLTQIATTCGEYSLQEIEQLAGSGNKLTFDRMCEVQKYVVSNDQAKFRQCAAYTSIRHERYAYFSSLENIFRTKVSVDDGDDCHPLIKAVRLYLDIIFFHPFGDGNARAAMLWFAFYALRYRFNVPDFRKLHGFGFVPGNKACYWMFSAVVIQEVARCDTFVQ
ncbi:hypothetical protein Lepto7375DRAFT_1957 [Leptolyngbya sp. PCC 7375]|nr:hypothetical protein Lepto7375DRAFT_1957 [Leptolyngbya sp. PCC 7375]